MNTRKNSKFILGAGVAALTVLSGVSVFAAPTAPVPYGAPLPAPGGGGPGGPGGPGGFRGGGGMFTIGQISSVSGSSFVVAAMSFGGGDPNNVTIKTTPTTEIIKSVDSTIDAIKVGDTLQVGGRPDADNNIPARRITIGTLGTGFPGGGGPRPGAAAGGGAPGGPGAAGGGGGAFRRFAPISGVVTVLSPLTIKAADGTTYTIDTSNDPTVSANVAGKIDDIVSGKYATIIGAPPATPAPNLAPGTPMPAVTNVTAVRITLSDTAPRFGGRGGGGRGAGGGGGGFGGGAGAGGAVQ